jgi:hypothetical protein
MRSKAAAVLVCLLCLVAFAGCRQREEPNLEATIAADPSVQLLTELDGSFENLYAAIFRQREIFHPSNEDPVAVRKPPVPEKAQRSSYRQVSFKALDRINTLVDQPVDPTPVTSRYEFPAARKQYGVARDTFNAYLDTGNEDLLWRSIAQRKTARALFDKLKEDLKRFPMPHPIKG